MSFVCVCSSRYRYFLGNLLELFQGPVGETEFTWQSLYGNVVRFRGIFGVSPLTLLSGINILNKPQEERLLVADPKALQKILNMSGYTYSILPNFRAIFRLIMGQGIFSADGSLHFYIPFF